MAGDDDQLRLVGRLDREVERPGDGGGDPVGPGRLRPAGIDDRLAEPAEGPLVGGEDAVDLVVEELVEGAPRDPGPVDQVTDRQLGVALLGHRRGGRVEQALALVGDDDVLRQGVRAAGQLGGFVGDRTGSTVDPPLAWLNQNTVGPPLSRHTRMFLAFSHSRAVFMGTA